jgi:hypothetical protein
MLGLPKPRRRHPITISLEELVLANQSHCREAKFDLGLVREWARDLSAECGRPSVDLVVFFKLQWVIFLERVRSERELIETAQGGERAYLTPRLGGCHPLSAVLTYPTSA